MVGLIASLQLAMSEVQLAQQAPPAPSGAAPQGATGAPQAGRGGGRGRVDPRVQQRTYTFADTNEQLPYALYVSSKVTKDKKNPLIISLHGLGGDQDTMVRESLGAVELAEQGGYILAAPMGYNCGGWYGIPAGARGGGGRGPAPAAPPQAAAPQAPAPQADAPNANAGGAPQRGGGRGGGAACAGGGTAVTDAAKVRELSEKDVMTVLDMLRKEFNVDERRIYVMGHSMGGSGTLYLASKYPQIWAAAAAIAPPGAGGAGVAESLGKSKLPTFVVQGDMDTAVPVNGTRQFIERLKAQNANYEYLEIPGAGHNIIGVPEIYAFFAKHSKPASR